MKLFRIAFALLAGLALAAPVRADEEKIPLDKLPAKVTAAVKAKFKGAELVSAEKETKDGKTTYEVAIKYKGKNIDVGLNEDGTITVAETEIAVKDLPKTVTDAVSAKYPKGTMEKAEEVTKGGKTTFEVLVTTADKKKVEVYVDDAGKITETKDVKEEKK